MAAVPEIFVKWAVNFADDPKVVRLNNYGEDAGLCRDLYREMVCYCRRNLTDGFVPELEVVRLAFPLAMPRAQQLAQHLASEHLTEPVDGGWLVCAYTKRNGTRADVESRSNAQRDRALRRWHDFPPDANGTANGNAAGSAGWSPSRYAEGNAESESESDKPRAHAPARTRTRGPALPSRTAAEITAAARRPGGPSADPTRRAADARRQLAQRPLDEPDPARPLTEPGSGQLHGEDLARAQVAEARHRRAAQDQDAEGPQEEADDDQAGEEVDHDSPDSSIPY
jgi:hypothetical protein